MPVIKIKQKAGMIKRRNFPKINNTDPTISNDIIAQAMIQKCKSYGIQIGFSKCITVWLNTYNYMGQENKLAAKRIRRGLIALIYSSLNILYFIQRTTPVILFYTNLLPMYFNLSSGKFILVQSVNLINLNSLVFVSTTYEGYFPVPGFVTNTFNKRLCIAVTV
ncbi:hypothetical protein CS542_02035 [Pedobacter sp. IW39]|nr:hypothetical protein CS542_02035 [Pedobacter sp. IW39]